MINIIISISRIHVYNDDDNFTDAKEYIYHLILFHEIYTIINNFIIIPKQEADHNILIQIIIYFVHYNIF